MISMLTENIIEIIKGDDLTEVYSAFDNISAESKSGDFYTVVMPLEIHGKNITAIPDGTAYDFDADFKIICLADRNFKAIDFFDFLQDKVIERIISPENNITVLEFQTSEPEFDFKLQKMKISCNIKIGGTYIAERIKNKE